MCPHHNDVERDEANTTATVLCRNELSERSMVRGPDDGDGRAYGRTYWGLRAADAPGQLMFKGTGTRHHHNHRVRSWQIGAERRAGVRERVPVGREQPRRTRTPAPLWRFPTLARRGHPWFCGCPSACRGRRGHFYGKDSRAGAIQAPGEWRWYGLERWIGRLRSDTRSSGRRHSAG